MRRGVTWKQIRQIALALPDVEESTSYGTPAFKVKKKLFVRLKEDLETVVLVIGFDNRELLMQARPEAFFITDHYRNYPSVLMRMAAVSLGEAREVVTTAHQAAMPKTQARKRRPSPTRRLVD